ncbi:MAG: hypothetical protein HYU34_04945 [Candidatus Omnitrophica bacterium]|nr:hypothetical protein [Candidatus Omnitrophota bacterium]
MNNSDQTALTHDFEVLLRYVAGQKVMLTPKQKFIPVRDEGKWKEMGTGTFDFPMTATP